MKNRYEIHGDITFIFIRGKGQELVTRISTSDLPKVNSFRGTWFAHWCQTTKAFYVWGKLGNSTILLHRFILEAKDGEVVDHRNHDTLDNTRGNIRLCTKAENNQNKKGAYSNSSSGVPGVVQRPNGRWRAYVYENGRQKTLGHFGTMEEAKAVVEGYKKMQG